jgi:hypothetical protein
MNCISDGLQAAEFTTKCFPCHHPDQTTMRQGNVHRPSKDFASLRGVVFTSPRFVITVGAIVAAE